ncbi:hypothetical protein RRF57_009680 [Xylaria bambusicola]|uniref:Uncharacterized protein n=1 Tax=Xylaria bambusicola TaxID=326684 RepID=A0AAN7ZC45_9PEZI
MMNIAILDVPVLFEAGRPNSSVVLSYWAKMYEHGTRLYPSISVTVGLLYFYALLHSKGGSRLKSSSNRQSWKVYLIAAVATLTMIPWTLLVMMPTNQSLMAARESVVNSGVAEASWEVIESLVVDWQRLHFIRSLFPLAGSLIGMLGDF